MFFDVFKALCEQKKMSPNAVGEKIGVSSGTITNWKKGRVPKLEHIQLVADYFHVKVDFLLERGILKYWTEIVENREVLWNVLFHEIPSEMMIPEKNISLISYLHGKMVTDFDDLALREWFQDSVSSIKITQNEKDWNQKEPYLRTMPDIKVEFTEKFKYELALYKYSAQLKKEEKVSYLSNLEMELLTYFRQISRSNQQREVARLQLLAEQAEAERTDHNKDNAAM